MPVFVNRRQWSVNLSFQAGKTIWRDVVIDTYLDLLKAPFLRLRIPGTENAKQRSGISSQYKALNRSNEYG